MREQNLIDELKRFDADERFALEKCGYSPDDKLEGRQKEIFEYERKSVREKITTNLSNIKNWNKINQSFMEKNGRCNTLRSIPCNK